MRMRKIQKSEYHKLSGKHTSKEQPPENIQKLDYTKLELRLIRPIMKTYVIFKSEFIIKI